MHFPLGREECGDVVFAEVFRRAVRAVDHPDLAHARQRGDVLFGQLLAGAVVGQCRHMQDITGPQRATAMPAKLAEGEGTFAAQIIRHLHAAAQAQITARAGAADAAQLQCRAGRDQQRGVHRHRFSVKGQGNRRAGHRDHRVTIEAQDRPAHGDFQRGCALFIAEQAITQTQCSAVHRPRRRHADGPIAEAAGIVLHAGLRAGAEHFEGVGVIEQIVQTTGPQLAAGEWSIEQNLPQVIAVGFHAI